MTEPNSASAMPPEAAAVAASSDDVTQSAAPTPVSFAEALRFWLKLGFISFGGPAGQIALMHRKAGGIAACAAVGGWRSA